MPRADSADAAGAFFVTGCRWGGCQLQTALAELPRAIRDASGNPMDQRIEFFLADVLALAGEEPDVVRDEVRVALGDYEAIFRAQETNKRMKGQCRSRLPRAVPRSRRRGAGAPPGDTQSQST